MKRITEITRRDIFDIIRGGYTPPDSIDSLYLSWSGRLEEINFLKRLYRLSSLPSYDFRSNDAEGDIYQHRVINYDWEDEWIFEDARFDLLDGDDEILLDFLCEMFHPVVRREDQAWELFVGVFNELLYYDGYELYEKNYISGRAIYGWRDISTKNIVIENQAESLAKKFDSEYIAAQIKYLEGAIETDPSEAIGKSKELLESCCKTILEENSIVAEKTWDVSRLIRETCKILKLTPDDITDTAKASETIKKLLGNLSVISQSMAELRNNYGSGHGKPAKYRGLTPRHARLAVGAAVTASHFIWETYEEQQMRGKLK
jgi:hypothetical protein